MSRIWRVPTPDVPCIVVAETADYARELVIDYLDLAGHAEEQDDVGVPHDVTNPRGWRWVETGAASDRDNMTRDLDVSGVEVPDRILWRETYRPGIGAGGPRWYGVGARDVDWCRLPAQVLSGGAE
jgi:hypothetical protein